MEQNSILINVPIPEVVPQLNENPLANGTLVLDNDTAVGDDTWHSKKSWKRLARDAPAGTIDLFPQMGKQKLLVDNNIEPKVDSGGKRRKFLVEESENVLFDDRMNDVSEFNDVFFRSTNIVRHADRTQRKS